VGIEGNVIELKTKLGRQEKKKKANSYAIDKRGQEKRGDLNREGRNLGR